MASCQDEQRDVKMQEETSRAFSSHARLVFSYVHKFHKFKPEPIALSLRPTNSWSHDILGIYMASTLGLPIFTDSRIHSIWRFPKMGGTPKSSISKGFSTINHPAIGLPPFMETTISAVGYAPNTELVNRLSVSSNRSNKSSPGHQGLWLVIKDTLQVWTHGHWEIRTFMDIMWGLPYMGIPNSWLVYKGKSYSNGWWLGVPLWLRKPSCGL